MMYEVVIMIEGQETEKVIGTYETETQAESALRVYRNTQRHWESKGGPRAALWIEETL